LVRARAGTGQYDADHGEIELEFEREAVITWAARECKLRMRSRKLSLANVN